MAETTKFQGSVDVDVSESVMMSSGKYVGMPITGFYEATQVVGNSQIKLAARRYGNGDCVEEYSDFLLDMKNNHQILKPAYVLQKGDEKVMVFSQRIDCTLAAYVAKEDVFTGDNEIQSYQRDFRDDMICIYRQMCTGVQGLHNRQRRCGALTLESIYLKLGGPMPKVYFLPPYYEEQTAGNVVKMDTTYCSTHLLYQDWVSFGGILLETIDLKAVTMDTVKEIGSLHQRMVSGEVTRYSHIDKDPTLLYEDNKMTFFFNSFEGVFKVFRNDFLAPDFCEPGFLKAMSWRKKFRTILVNIQDEYRCRYNFAEEPDGILNFMTFLWDCPQHIGSSPYLKQRFGDGMTFLRYARDVYPKLFEDLISLVELYRIKDPTLGNLLQKLNEDPFGYAA